MDIWKKDCRGEGADFASFLQHAAATCARLHSALDVSSLHARIPIFLSFVTKAEKLVSLARNVHVYLNRSVSPDASPAEIHASLTQMTAFRHHICSIYKYTNRFIAYCRSDIPRPIWLETLFANSRATAAIALYSKQPVDAQLEYIISTTPTMFSYAAQQYYQPPYARDVREQRTQYQDRQTIPVSPRLAPTHQPMTPTTTTTTRRDKSSRPGGRIVAQTS